MGNVDLTQVKSSVQATGGDAEGAKRTQGNFVRTVPLISQAVSLGYAIAGDIEGAKKVHNEFLKATSEFVEVAPVLQHVEGLGHHIAGNSDKGDQVMMGATKSTISVLATNACAQGGPAAAVACADGSNSLADSVATGEGQELVDQLELDEFFGAALEQGLLMNGAADAAASKMKSSYATRSRRSITEASNPLLFDSSLPDTTLLKLPGSVNETLTDIVQAQNTQDLVGGILSLFYILKLMMFGHSQSRPYYKEICQNQFAYQNRLKDCENDLFNALQKYQQLESSSDTSDNNTLEPALLTSLDVLVFELTELESKSIVGKGLAALMCSPEVTFEANTQIEPDSFSDEEAWKFRTSPKSCVEDLFSGLASLTLEFSKFSTNILKRMRRASDDRCTQKFFSRHVQDDEVFDINAENIARNNAVRNNANMNNANTNNAYRNNANANNANTNNAYRNNANSNNAYTNNANRNNANANNANANNGNRNNGNRNNANANTNNPYRNNANANNAYPNNANVNNANRNNANANNANANNGNRNNANSNIANTNNANANNANRNNANNANANNANANNANANNANANNANANNANANQQRPVNLPTREHYITQNTVIPRRHLEEMRQRSTPVLDANGNIARAREGNIIYEFRGEYLQDYISPARRPQRMEGGIRFTIDKYGKINHMEPPSSSVRLVYDIERNEIIAISF